MIKIQNLKLVTCKTSKYRNIFVKVYTQNWTEEAFIIKSVTNTVSWTYVTKDLNGVENFGRFMKKNGKRQIKQSLELKK